MPNTNKTLRQAALDCNTDELTAFSTYAELVAACANGWAPMFRSDNSRLRSLGRQLEKDGRKVAWVAR